MTPGLLGQVGQACRRPQARGAPVVQCCADRANGDYEGHGTEPEHGPGHEEPRGRDDRLQQPEDTQW